MSEKSNKEEIAAKIQAEATTAAAKTSATALIIVALIGVISTIVVTLINKSDSIPIHPETISTPTLTIIFTPDHSTFTSTPAPTPTPYICPYHGKTDDETIRNLINAEADATNSEDLSIILKIFAPDATFFDYAPKPPKEWDNPLARYRDDLFKNTKFKGVKHFDISPAGPGIDGNTAYYTSGSMGYYLSDKGIFEKYSNPSMISTPAAKYGSDHWLLRKNDNGCWVIRKMEFNAGEIPFP